MLNKQEIIEQKQKDINNQLSEDLKASKEEQEWLKKELDNSSHYLL